MFLVRPLPSKHKRLSRKPRMTIALGMLCSGGALLAADTMLVNTDTGAAGEVQKVRSEQVPWGSFAISNAGDDFYASETLIDNIAQSLRATSKITGWGLVEIKISEELAKWSAPHYEVPATDLIVAAAITGKGVRLYHCQPRNTIQPKLEGYIAAGVGKEVTDPLQKTLFPATHSSAMQSPQRILREISYLIYRAKKDNAYCGKRTNAVYIRDGAAPDWVSGDDLIAAEYHSKALDFLLQMAARFALFSDPAKLEANANGLGQQLIALAGLRAVVFHNLEGDIIQAP